MVLSCLEFRGGTVLSAIFNSCKCIWHCTSLHIRLPFLQNRKTYNQFLQALIDLAPNCRPEKFLLDFEQAAFQSFQNYSIPRSTFIGLFFHLSQSYMRKFIELSLKVTCETNHGFSLTRIMSVNWKTAKNFEILSIYALN